FTPGQVEGPEHKLDLDMAALKEGPNTLEVRRTLGPSYDAARVTEDAAPAYYAAQLRQVVDQGTLGELLRGEELRVSRAYRKLAVRRQKDGTQRLLPGDKPITEFDAGDLMQCTLTIHSSEEREFVMVEVPLPSGCEVTEREEPEDPWSWFHWWSRTDIRDDRIVFFARRLPQGESTITYTLRAEVPGTSHALPATVSLMYQPEISASSAEAVLEVDQ
ncbi:MAG TPA: hypothetical protein VEI97_06220, partial [bacterium]|nr:hypothetical protein [bacterium]